jgi:hypothetical protein
MRVFSRLAEDLLTFEELYSMQPVINNAGDEQNVKIKMDEQIA